MVVAQSLRVDDGMPNQLVSIGLPVFNGEEYVERAILSLLNQTHANLEIIISDNASTDGTENICLELAQKDSRIRFGRNEANLGANQNFLRVLERARGPFFMWAACDDYWHEEFVSSMLKEHSVSNNVAVAMCTTRCVDEDGRLVYVQGFSGRLNPNTMSILRSLVSVGRVRYKFNYVIYGLHKTELLRKVFPSIPKTLSSDRLLALVVPLVGSIRYVDSEMYIRRVYTRPYHERYDDESGQNKKMLGYLSRGLVALRLFRSVAEIDVIPWYSKPLITVSIFSYLVSLVSQRTSETMAPWISGMKRTVKKLIR
jgi:glycosyltransferase involved in cell wall biosynthesis